MDRPGRQHPGHCRANGSAGPRGALSIPGPVDLFEKAPGPGEAPVVLATEAGFALKLLSPKPSQGEPALVPPGQGQLLIPIRGSVRVIEQGGGEGRVVSTERPNTTTALARGSLFRVANDARWALVGDGIDALVLAISTSVPREHDRVDSIFELARRRRHMAPFQLFSNETVRLEASAARGRLPFRGWVPYRHQAPGPEFAITLEGSFIAEMGASDNEPAWKGELPTGGLLRVPPETPHRFRARGRGLCIGLIVSGRAHQGSPTAGKRTGFTPFARP